MASGIPPAGRGRRTSAVSATLDRLGRDGRVELDGHNKRTVDDGEGNYVEA